MNRTLTLLVACSISNACLAGEKDDTASPVEKALRLRDKAPPSAPPTPIAIEFKGSDALIKRTVVEMVPERRRVVHNVVVQVPVTERFAIKGADGKIREETRTVFRPET